ncbi:MAG: manganese efflux pump [Ruminococcus sp.]|nr:manganese efflux pump [Ruminococcus sp.]
MSITELFFLAAGLAADAFSVSVCRGLGMKRINLRKAAVTALYFGSFQFMMPVAGYFFGGMFGKYINPFSHWAAFILLGFIGGKMIFEAFGEREENSGTELFILAIATSIDAFAVGIVFAAQKTELMRSASVIGMVTFTISFIGVSLGNHLGNKYEKKAEIAGGAVLILIGLKLLLEGLGVIDF